MAHHLYRHVNGHDGVVDGGDAGFAIEVTIADIFNQPGFQLARAAKHGLCRDTDTRMDAADQVLPLRQRLQIFFLTHQDIFHPPGQRAAEPLLD